MNALTGNMAALDTETFYTAAYSVKNMGYSEYTHNPYFRCTLVSAYDGKTSIVKEPEAFPWQQISGKILVAHNAAFDRAVFERLKELKIVPESVEPAGWICTALLCRYLQLPHDLATAAQRVLGMTLNKGVRARMMGTADLFDDAVKYAAEDAIASWRLYANLGHLWAPDEMELADLSQQIGRRGVPVNRGFLLSALRNVSKAAEELDAAIPFKPSLSLPKLKAAILAAGQTPPPSTNSKDPGFMAWAEENAGTPGAALVERRQDLNRARKTQANLEAMLRRVKKNGRMEYELIYCGAKKTGRWASAGGLNMQNMTKAARFGVKIRNAIEAPDGHKLLILDYAQIEARVLLFLAGDFDALKLLAGGMDIYEAHARRTMGYNDPRPMKDAAPDLRQLAKARVLALGFGCGAEKFIAMAKSLCGIDLTPEEAKRTVDEYRATNPLITGLWRALESTFVRHHGKTWKLPLPKTTFEPAHKRFLRYRDIDARRMTFEQDGMRVDTYGGKLAENWTQATARDAQGVAMLRLDNAGYEILLSTHDEVVLLVPEQDAAGALAHATAIMQKPLPWAKSLPLAVEGQIADVYDK